jgi:hypothetical protein
VSVARAVVEANHILNEGSDAPMGITEFRSRLQVHACVSVTRQKVPKKLGLSTTSQYQLAEPLRLRNFVALSLKERLLTGYTQSADVEITSVIEPMPKVVQS